MQISIETSHILNGSIVTVQIVGNMLWFENESHDSGELEQSVFDDIVKCHLYSEFEWDHAMNAYILKG